MLKEKKIKSEIRVNIYKMENIRDGTKTDSIHNNQRLLEYRNGRSNRKNRSIEKMVNNK